MSPSAAITSEALRLLELGHSEVMAFALAVVKRPCAPAAQRLALLTFTAAFRRQETPPCPSSASPPCR